MNVKNQWLEILIHIHQQFKTQMKTAQFTYVMNHYFSYTVTLDYKGLVLLMAKINDEDFKLGGQGLGFIEFCIFCMALRVSLLNAHLNLKQAAGLNGQRVNDCSKE